MKLLTEQELLPEEHFSKKGSTAEDTKLDKSMMNGLSRQSRTPMSIVSVDSAQCYDRVKHVIMSLVWLALIIVICLIKVLLHCLQTIKFFQRTRYEDSSTVTGGERLYFMGLGQGSKEAPPPWICLSSVIVNILRKLQHGAHIVDQMTGILIHSVGADLCCWVESMSSAKEPYETIQAETQMWGDLLLATGECLKPENISGTCYVDHECCEGKWEPRELVNWGLMIRVNDGNKKPICRLGPH